MRNFFRIITPISLIFILVGCATLYVTNINDVKEIKGSPTVYFLPKNVIRVKLDVIRTSHQCGPYNRFAKKLLGINNQYTEHTTLWKISGINIENYAIPDTANIYLIFNNQEKRHASLNFSDDGLLTSINSNPDSTENTKQNLILNLIREEKQHYLFTDISIKKIQINKSDTVYKKVRRDTGFVKEPQINTKIVNKNLEEKAEEISNQIFTIREEKINILSGDYNNSINGQAIKSIIEELDKIEEKYISLFTTIIRQDTISYTFEYIPEKNNSQNNILCYFSESGGISLKSDSSSTPVMIDLKRSGGNNSISEIITQKTKKKQKKNGYYYRIPEYADVRILCKSDIIASKKILISQFGSVMSLPSDNEYKSIEFYKNYGSLKSIH